MAEDDDLSFEALTFGQDSVSKSASQATSRLVTEVQKISTDDFIEDVEISIDGESEIAKNVILVFTSYGGKINPQAITSVAESCGKMKTQNFREKQCFGFIQFEEEDAVEKALQKFAGVDIDGSLIYAERCNKLTPGRDPRTHELNSDYKNSTLVFKNLPFQLKQEKLEEMLNTIPQKPLNVSYLYDASGMFRGMAFVKYKDIEQSLKAFEAFNNLDINGRKLRIEYKRKVKEADVLQEDDAKVIQDQLEKFTSGSLNELAFPCSSSFQRKQIHQIAEKFGLGHYSTGTEGENRYVLVKKREEVAIPTKAQPIKGRRRGNTTDSPKQSFDTKLSPDTNNAQSFGSSSAVNIPISTSRDKDKNWSGSYDHKDKSFSSSFEKDKNMLSSSPSSSFGSSKLSKSYGNSNLSSSFQSKSPSVLGTSPRKSSFSRTELPAQSIARQPKGPDGTVGFSAEYRKMRLSHTQNSNVVATV